MLEAIESDLSERVVDANTLRAQQTAGFQTEGYRYVNAGMRVARSIGP